MLRLVRFPSISILHFAFSTARYLLLVRDRSVDY
jgi:hypothetical protein